MSDLNNKVVIVTGAGNGIGRGIVNSLAAEGATVVCNDLDGASLEDLNAIENLYPIAGDISKLEDISAVVEFTLNKFGRIDYLVANAGITLFNAFVDISEDEFDKIAGLNIKGNFFLTQAVAKSMLAQGGGKIVLISSNLGARAYPKLSAYCVTKAAIDMMVKSLSAELGPKGININAVAPGPIETERTLQEVADYHEAWSEILPTGRPGSVDDVANTVKFLLSNSSDQINGQILYVDGGWKNLSVTPKF